MSPHPVAVPKLTYDKAHQEGNSKDFSFDFAGHFRGGDIDGLAFLAECKNYANASDQPKHFSSFLAKCYRAVVLKSQFADAFMWVTFAPFNASKWDTHASEDEIKKALKNSADRAINFTPDDVPEEIIDDDAVKKISDNLWVLVLSERQVEHLSLTPDHFAVIEAHITKEGMS